METTTKWHNVNLKFDVIVYNTEWDDIIILLALFSMCIAIGVWCIYAIKKVEGEKSSTYHLEKEFMPDEEEKSKRNKAGSEMENEGSRSLGDYLRTMAHSAIP